MGLTLNSFKHINKIEAMNVDIACERYLPLLKGGGYSILSGRGGLGKSMIALTALVEFLVTSNQDGLAIFTEDGKEEIVKRLWTICKNKYHMKKSEYYKIKDRIHFMTVETVEAINVESDLKIIGEFMILNNIGFSIFDPLKFFHNYDENSNSEMDSVMRFGFSRIGIITGAVVLVLHHSAKSAKGARGASTIEDTSRIAYSISARAKLVNGVVELDENYKGRVQVTVGKDSYGMAKDLKILDEDGMITVFPKEINVVETTFETASMPTIIGG